jgi:hypothetical protein
MNYASFLDLVHNLTLLLATAFVFDLATTGLAHEKALSRRMLIGASLGIMGIIAMLVPWTAAPGIIFDSRFILHRKNRFFFGPRHGRPGAGKKKTLWLQDVTVFPDFQHAENADDLGLHGAFGFPVTVGVKWRLYWNFFLLKSNSPTGP